MSRNESGPANEISGLAHGAGRRSISSLSVVRLILLPYLDPGSGSFLIQILIAAVLGGVVSAGLWFRRVLGIFRRSSGASRTASGPEPPDLDEVDGQNRNGPGGVGER